MTIAKFIPSVEIKHAKDTTDNSKVWFDYWINRPKKIYQTYLRGTASVVMKKSPLVKW